MNSVKVLSVLTLAFAYLCTCAAYSDNINFYGSDPSQFPPTCSRLNKPCRVSVRVSNENQSVDTEYLSNVCECPGEQTCPRGWDQDPSRTVTRYLRQHGKSVTLQLKFCNPVQAERMCRPNEVALTLTGVSVLPQEVKSVICRCPSNSPMYLQRVWLEDNSFARNQNFTCTMAQCDMNAGQLIPCQLNRYENFNRRETIVVCQCPPDHNCRIIPGTHPGADGGYVRGFCTAGSSRGDW